MPIFLKLDGIDGESIDHKHKGEIELESFSWGVQNTGNSDTGGKGGQVSFQDFTFTTRVGIQSSQLFRALVNSTPINTGTLTVDNSKETEKSKGQQEFLVVMLRDILISSYKEDAGSTLVPGNCEDQKNNAPDQKTNVAMESVSLNFAKIEIKS